MKVRMRATGEWLLDAICTVLFFFIWPYGDVGGIMAPKFVKARLRKMQFEGQCLYVGIVIALGLYVTLDAMWGVPIIVIAIGAYIAQTIRFGIEFLKE